MERCDLLLRGGRVVDPANGIDSTLDVAISGDRILAVGERLDLPAARCVDVSGYLVTPGLVDMHCHCYPAFPYAQDALPTLHPDAHMPQNGVTTCVDAGTCGHVDFPRFRESVIDRASTRVLAFLNIADAGMVRMTGEDDPGTFHPEAAAEVARAYPDCVVGFKTAHYWVHKPFDSGHPAWASVDAMVLAGEKCALPCMADFQPTLPGRSYRELLMEHLRPGDIHTHMYAQQFPVLDERGGVNPLLRQARDRGIRFDLGHGACSFWFRNAVPAVRDGFPPDTISTDLYLDNVAGPVFGLNHVMSRFLCMGMPVAEVIRRVTIEPARTLHRRDFGTLTPGACADVAVLAIERRDVHFADGGRARMAGDCVFACAMSIRAGRIVYDPWAMALPDWETAPEAYWKAPGILKGV